MSERDPQCEFQVELCSASVRKSSAGWVRVNFLQSKNLGEFCNETQGELYNETQGEFCSATVWESSVVSVSGRVLQCQCQGELCSVSVRKSYAVSVSGGVLQLD